MKLSLLPLAMLLAAFPAAARSGDPATRLADQMESAMQAAERWSISSEFPPDYQPVELARYALIALDRADQPHAVEARALDLLSDRPLSHPYVGAIEILRRQIDGD